MGTIEKFNNLTFVASFLVTLMDDWMCEWMLWIELNWIGTNMKWKVYNYNKYMVIPPDNEWNKF